LIAGGYWRAAAAAAASVAAMTLASYAAFGAESWRAFFDSLAFTRETVIEQGATGFEKIQSVFAAVRLMGGSVGAAYAAQSLVAALTLAALAYVWRSGADARVKAAVAIVATLLTTPYCLDYDMMALGPAIAFCLAHGLEKGFAPFEKSVLVVAFAAPLGARAIATLAPAPLGAAAIALLFLVATRRAPAPRFAEGFRRARDALLPRDSRIGAKILTKL
jgi:alpha-1,2-mannosyltransferase